MKLLCGFLMTILLCGVCASARERASDSSSALPSDTESLRVYLGTMLQAYQAGDTATFNQLANDLKLPSSDQWFRKSFGPDQVSTMNEKYDQSFQAFRSRLAKNFEKAGNVGTEVILEARNSKPLKGTSSSPTAPIPKVNIEIHSYRCVLTVQGKPRIEWMDSYVVVDGSLRYIGQGAFPFWGGPLIIKANS